MLNVSVILEGFSSIKLQIQENVAAETLITFFNILNPLFRTTTVAPGEQKGPRLLRRKSVVLIKNAYI